MLNNILPMVKKMERQIDTCREWHNTHRSRFLRFAL